MVIQLAPAAAVQAHPDTVLTAIVFVEADGPSEATVGEIEYVQGAPACVAVKVCPPIVIVPVRLDVDVFAATE